MDLRVGNIMRVILGGVSGGVVGGGRNVILGEEGGGTLGGIVWVLVHVETS